MSAYTTHLILDTNAGQVWWEIRNRGRFVARCHTPHMANRIVAALARKAGDA